MGERKSARHAARAKRERERERERAMVVVQAWDDFYAKAEELLRSKPLDCRYTVKYKHNEGKMVLKVTDDSQCWTYKTNQASDLKKMEKLNHVLTAIMTRGPNVDLDALDNEQKGSKK